MIRKYVVTSKQPNEEKQGRKKHPKYGQQRRKYNRTVTATNTVTGFPLKHRHKHTHQFVYIIAERAYTQATLAVAHIQKQYYRIKENRNVTYF